MVKEKYLQLYNKVMDETIKQMKENDMASLILFLVNEIEELHNRIKKLEKL